MFLLLNAGLVQKCFFFFFGLGRRWEWVIIRFLGFKGGRLFESGCLLTFWVFRVHAYWKVGG